MEKYWSNVNLSYFTRTLHWFARWQMTISHHSLLQLLPLPSLTHSLLCYSINRREMMQWHLRSSNSFIIFIIILYFIFTRLVLFLLIHNQLFFTINWKVFLTFFCLILRQILCIHSIVLWVNFSFCKFE